MSQLPYNPMTISEISQKTCLTRQWLNRLADRGEIPGITRKPNGRLKIQADPKLRNWITITARSVSRQRARRVQIHDRALANVTKQINRITVENTRHADLKKDLEKVRALRREESALKIAVVRDHYTTGEIASETGYNRRHIARLAQEIPGAAFSGTRWIFPKSDKLHTWIRDARNEREAAIRRANAEKNGNTPEGKAVVTVTSVLRKLYDVTKSVVENRPVEDWSLQECNAFLQETEPFLEIAEDVRCRWDHLKFVQAI